MRPPRLVPKRVAWLLRLAMLLAAMPLPLQFGLRAFDPDEWQHAQMTWLIGEGRVPFRDFFEHHMPLLHLLATPLAALMQPEETVGRAFSFMVLLRLAAVFLTLLHVWVVRELALRLGLGRPAALLAAVLFLGSGIVLSKGQEFRPDVPAALLVTLACLVLVSDWRPARRAAVAGLCMGLAVAFTQKCLLLLPGFGLAFAWRLWADRPTRRDWFAAAVSGIAATALPFLLLLLGFAAFDAAGEFFTHAIANNAAWPAQRPVGDSLRGPLVSSPVTAMACVLGLLALVVARPDPRGPAVLAPLVLSGLGGMAVLPLFYGQYLMLFLGPAVVMAAAVLAFSRPVIVGSAFAAAAQAWVVMASQLPMQQFREWNAVAEIYAEGSPGDLGVGGFKQPIAFRHPATRRFFYNREVCPALTVAEQAELIRALAEDARVRFASNELYGCLRDPALAEILNTRFEPTRSPWLLIRRG
jgi:hypothetical protein